MANLTLNQVVAGYELAAHARKLSEHTILDYLGTFSKFSRFLEDDPDFKSITIEQVREFLANQTTVSKKTVLNYHTGLSALWTWAVKEKLADFNPLENVKRPRPEQRVIEPFTEQQIRLMLNSASQSKVYSRPGKKPCTNTQPDAIRNRAIILLLLDTGIRAQELCDLRIRDVDLREQFIKPFGKMSKERIIPISARTAQSIWKYLASERKDALVDKPLFVTGNNKPLQRDQLYKRLKTLADRCGIQDVHPHRFRHTFAINYLRNGGDIYTLQKILGHTTLDMVKNYLAIAETDIFTAHRRASPVDQWCL